MNTLPTIPPQRTDHSPAIVLGKNPRVPLDKEPSDMPPDTHAGKCRNNEDTVMQIGLFHADAHTLTRLMHTLMYVYMPMY